ncbi:hypothetical protein [Shouchella clausii]|uniref:hypothetical protein n=1 Tax=Shouchella clausii TaxID=79880 RepID=UPI001C738A21|nr:hypothetical protein [Shouchella clausii]MBX0320257.1 hypothetical protein [Shouchella clausii]MEB5480726.1 hypothetical protein [Shouchella clausii]
MDRIKAEIECLKKELGVKEHEFSVRVRELNRMIVDINKWSKEIMDSPLRAEGLLLIDLEEKINDYHFMYDMYYKRLTHNLDCLEKRRQEAADVQSEITSLRENIAFLEKEAQKGN